MARLLLALVVLGCSVAYSKSARKNPVILVPGLGASQLWQKRAPENIYRSMWVYPRRTIFGLSSLVEDMKLNVNASTGSTSDDRGQTVKACGFGNPKTLTGLVTSWNPFEKPYPHMTSSDCDGEVVYDDDYDFDGFNKSVYRMLHPKGGFFGDLAKKLWSKLSGFCKSGKRKRRSITDCFKKIAGITKTWDNVHYFKHIIKTLEKKGYRANVDIKGAPYDFRKAPNELTEYFKNLKRLIEKTYSKNGNSRVVLVAHSNGNPVLLYFYNHVVTREWKDTYIRAHVALAPPWAGATKTVKLMVSGDNVDMPFVKGKQLRPMQRSWPTIAWLMPSPAHGLWKQSETLVKTDRRTYGVGDYRQLFHDLGYPAGYRMWEAVEKDAAADLSKPPEVRELHVFYGTGVRTPGHFVYKGSGFPDSEPSVVNEKDGDGTVNRRSLEAFKKVRSTQFTNVSHHAFPGMDHMEVLRSPRVLEFLVTLVFSKEPPLPPRPSKTPSSSSSSSVAGCHASGLNSESAFSKDPPLRPCPVKSRSSAAVVFCGWRWSMSMLALMVLGLFVTP